MKHSVKLIALTLALCTLLSLLASCSSTKEHRSITEEPKTTSSETSEKAEEKPGNIVTIKPSPDKYTWYIKNYVGKNCASFGYTSLGGKRLDAYGKGLLSLIFVSPDGTYVDISSDETLQKWMVTGQNLEPNTELKLTFDKDSDGVEYDNLVERQSYEEIILSVRKVSDTKSKPVPLTKINASPDKYTEYISDYIGRNLAGCGYVSLGGEYLAEYGKTVVKLVIVTEDGSYVDFSEEDILKQYVVTNQSIAPNTELKLIFDKDSDGIEYDNLVESQNIDEIELYVKKLN